MYNQKIKDLVKKYNATIDTTTYENMICINFRKIKYNLFVPVLKEQRLNDFLISIDIFSKIDIIDKNSEYNKTIRKNIENKVKI